MNILEKLSFKYRVYHSIMYTSHLYDAAIILARELRQCYGWLYAPEVMYYEGKYAKLRFIPPIEVTITKKDIKTIADEYDKSYFADISIKKVTDEEIVIYINFK